jgi:hypothetical protein
MGVGMPEYVLIFRKPATDKSNAYADLPVVHSKEEYKRGRWQLDAHDYWKSDGKRLISIDDLKRLELKHILKLWEAYNVEGEYDFKLHEQLCVDLDEIGKLPTTYMAVPPISNNPEVWTDITRMQTLNSDQVRKSLTKHICPLQLDMIERVIERYSNKGEVVLDPFGGIMSVPYQAVKMGRKGVGIELNKEYWSDGIKHLKHAELAGKKELSLFEMA